MEGKIWILVSLPAIKANRILATNLKKNGMTAFELELAKQVIEDKCFHDVTLNIMSQNNLLSCVRES